MSVVKQMRGEYRAKSDHLMTLNKNVKVMKDSFALPKLPIFVLISPNKKK